MEQTINCLMERMIGRSVENENSYLQPNIFHFRNLIDISSNLHGFYMVMMYMSCMLVAYSLIRRGKGKDFVDI